MFGGNSRDALEPDTDGKGPFESHTGGNLLMKELRFPWVHWHSDVAGAPVDPNVLEPSVASHRWARNQEQRGTLVGAEVCETEVAMPAIRRWTAARFDAIAAGSLPMRPGRILRQVVTCPTVNFVNTKSGAIADGAPGDLPAAFFLDSETLCGAEGLGLDSPPPIRVPAEDFQAVLLELEVHLDDRSGFQLDGDTFFPFLVPERAFEDIAVALAAVDVLYVDRFLAALVLVDLSSPVFSPDREGLLDLLVVSDDPRSAHGFSQVMAERIRAAAPDAVRTQFLEIWDAGDGWRDVANARLHAYYDKLTERVTADPRSAFRDWFRVAESRRRHAMLDLRMPIFEAPLLTAQCNLPDDQRFRLLLDGTVSQHPVPPPGQDA